MRFFLDTEFIEDGHTIDLISIGIVAEDGREYYAESQDCDLTRASEWVQRNVLPHLVGGAKSRADIASEITTFVGDTPVFWGYHADYDWVMLCQLYGRMIDLPSGWPMYCRDLKQEADRLNLRLPKAAAGAVEHHALADARWTMQAWQWLRHAADGPR